MENIIKAVESDSWELIRSNDDSAVKFSTIRWSYTITKRPIFGYRLAIESLESIKRDDLIFKTEDLLLDYIKDHKTEWESKALLNL